MRNTSNDASAESGFYFGLALHKHKPSLPPELVNRICASEAIYWQNKDQYSWLNKEAFTMRAIETYEGQTALVLMRD